MSKDLYHAHELKQLSDALGQLHASSNAISFFLASYRTGRATVGQIARLCQMDRSSGYLACQQLVDLGLMDEDASSGKKIVLAKSPKTVLSRLRTAARSLRRHHDVIEESLPTLMAGYAAQGNKPVLEFYSGKLGLQQLTEDILESASGGEILLFTNQQMEKNVFTEADHRDFIAGRLVRDISIRVLAADTPEAHALQGKDRQTRRETRIVKGVPFTNETYIYGDKVAMLSFDQEILGFTVRSKDFVEFQRWVFEQLWEQTGDQHG
ncbi:MAG: hypothetical protein WC654_03815 [Patescibacteria group bacterium]